MKYDVFRPQTDITTNDDNIDSIRNRNALKCLHAHILVLKSSFPYTFACFQSG